MPPPKVTRVALALIKREGKYLICQRRAGKILGGYWEFPGGKCEAGESWDACLHRELREELGVTVKSVRYVTQMRYRYPKGWLSFRVFRCGIAGGRPQPLAAQTLRWVSPTALTHYRFPPANIRLIMQLTSCSRKLS